MTIVGLNATLTPLLNELRYFILKINHIAYITMAPSK